MPTIHVRNAHFYYELHGQGEPLVLISGYGADHVFWLPILAQLAQYFRVLIFDNRAIGQTKDHETFPLSADYLADDTVALISALGMDNPHIIGHSMGGTVLQRIAARYPKHTHKIAILNSSVKWRQAMLSGLKSALSLRKQNGIADTVVDALIPWLFGEAFLQNPSHVELVRTSVLNNPHAQSLIDQERQFAALQQFDGRAGLSQITAPALLIYGKEDIISLPQESETLAAGIRGSTLHALEGGHMSVVEDTRALVSALLSFFKA